MTAVPDVIDEPRQSRIGAIDLHVAQRIRDRRVAMGVRQVDIAEGLGVRHAQVQKYEKGVDRVSASRLYDLARLLNVPIDYFFEGLGTEEMRPVSYRERLTLELIRNFALIADLKRQEAVMILARALAGVND